MMSELQVGDRVQTGIGILCHISKTVPLRPKQKKKYIYKLVLLLQVNIFNL